MGTNVVDVPSGPTFSVRVISCSYKHKTKRSWILLPTRTSLSNKYNSQEQRGNDDDDDDGKTNYIPTIINGITDTTHMSQLNSRNK
jgi:hypothetical protein